MDTPSPHLAAIRTVQARCISTSEPTASPREEMVDVIMEVPLLIDVEGIERYTILCAPIDKRFLAMGFLFSEGLINGLDDISLIRECEDDPNIVRVRLAGKGTDKNVYKATDKNVYPTDEPRTMESGRNLVIVSSCGACGTEEFASKLEALPKVGDSLRIEHTLLRSAIKDISGNQPLFNACGGTHWAGIFDGNGKLIAHAEDTGRHSALDKAIGKCLLNRVPFRGCWAVLSGRVSLEMVSKCARAGIELIAAISAPTSLAIETAERCGITLCAFVRENRATLFSHPHRIIGLDE